jgi:hypothetical protein
MSNAKGKIQKKYLCLYPDCDKRYVATDGLRKHCNKNHGQWIKGKKPRDYGYEIPTEYEGDDYVREYMTMVRVILADEENNTSPAPKEPSPPPREEVPTPLVFSPFPFVLLPPQIPADVDLNIPIDFYASLFSSENI